MTFKQILQDLNLDYVGHYKKDDYVIDLDSSDEFSQVYSKLENSEAEQLEDKTLVTETLTSMTYRYKKCYIRLSANYETDDYKMTLTGKEEKESED